MTLPTTPLQHRSYLITTGSAVLCAVFTWFAVMIWFIEFAETVPYEIVIRTLVCAAFAAIAVVLAKTARRGYTKRRLRELVLELLSGGF